ncbi:hypothetical protein SAMN05421748_12441 [Paractinoplanes atraurantiacus]|uniref:Uncharacterized protein n=1 Tax=Paractinoplanes atraurantiacus TaxID=1036182 RepID=A0A285JR95_9ACTN|nr:hypothetical protein SAMN05421748_12441 [Actinoplanes atraurantiacus]
MALRLARLSLDEQRWHVLIAEFALQATTDPSVAAVYLAGRHRLMTALAGLIRDNATHLGVHGVIEPEALPLERRVELFSAVLRL